MSNRLNRSRRRDLPEVVRIKRKRNQSSLQALILEAPKSKRAKNESYIFKLQRTDTDFVQLPSDGTAMLPLLQESSHKADKDNTFVIPKEQAETEELPEELNDMLSSLLRDSTPQPTKGSLKKRKHISAFTSSTATDASKPSGNVELEYVYDVYYRDKAVQESWEKDRIGYIKFEEDYDDLIGDDDSEKQLSDDEDSNAEDFYKNDYPEDEDEYSSVDEEDDDDDSFEKLTETLHTETQTTTTVNFEELYDEYYDQDGNGPQDLLAALDDDGFDGDDDSDMDMDEPYPRQHFFPGEEDDELAQHRDRIFGKLQKMIDEE